MSTKFVGTGGNFANMAAAATFYNALNFTENETLYVDGTVTDAGQVTFNPTTANGFSLTILPKPGQEITGRLFPDYTLGRATLISNAQYEHCWQFVGKVYVRGLQMKRNHGNGSTVVIASNEAVISGNIIDGRIGAGWGMIGIGSLRGISRMNVYVGTTAVNGGVYDQGSGLSSERDTFIDCHTGFRTDYTTGYCIGGVFYNCANDFNGTSPAESGYNSTSNTTFSGTGFDTDGVTSVSSADFVSVAGGSEDFRRASSSTKLGNNGPTIAGITTDIYGTAVPQGGTPDRGAYEYPQVVVPVITGPTGSAGDPSITVSGPDGVSTLGTWTAANSAGFSLSGTDAALLVIHPTTGVVTKASGVFDITWQPSYSFNVDNGSATQAVTFNLTDGTAPVLTGNITVGAITSSGFTLAMPASTDNVSVTNKQYRLNGGAWIDTDSGGTSNTATITGASAATTYTPEMRVRDAAGNASSPPIGVAGAGTVTTLSPAGASLTVRLYRDAAGTDPAANLSNLEYMFFEVAKPSLVTGAPFKKGSTGTTNSSGDMILDLAGTTLLAGNVGYLVVDSTDGLPGQSGRRFFCGPAVVA